MIFKFLAGRPKAKAAPQLTSAAAFTGTTPHDTGFVWRRTFERGDDVYAVTAAGETVRLGTNLLQKVEPSRSAWFPRGQLWINDSFSLLEIATFTGERNTLILDGRGEILGPLDQPPKILAKVLASAVAQPLLAQLFRAVSPDPATLTLLQLTEETRAGLVQLLADTEFLPTPKNIVSLDQLAKVELDPKLNKDGIRSLFKIDWSEKALDSFRRSRLLIPSHSRERGTIETVVPLGSKEFAIKSVSGDGVVCIMFIFAWYGTNGVTGMYFPGQGVSILHRGRSWLADYEARFGQLCTSALDGIMAALPHLAFPPKRTGVAVLSRTLKGNHLGHTLWNVFSGLVHAVNHSEAAPSRPWFYDLPASVGQEIYGPTVNIFPELEGGVRTNASTYREAYVDATRNGRTLVPFVSKEIPQNLRERLVRRFADDPAIAHMESVSGHLFAPGASGEDRLVIAFGLRLQNRTIPELVDFYAAIARKLKARTGRRLVIVVDGMNSVKSMVRDFSEDMFVREHDFVEALEKQLGPDFTLVSCVGARMSENIYFLGKAAFFVAPHGGGLTKYRWIMNIPGYVLTSPQNLKFSRWLRIYDKNQGTAPDQWGNFENCSPLFYTNEDEAEDIILPGQELKDGRLVGRWNGTLSPNNFRLLDLDKSADRVVDCFFETQAEAALPRRLQA